MTITPCIADSARLGEEHFRVLADSLPHLVWTAGPDGATDYLNRQGANYAGLCPEDNYGRGWLSVVHPDDVTRTIEAWDHAVRTHAPFEDEYRLRRFDGEYRWHLCRCLPLLDENNNIVKWIGTCTDIEDSMRLRNDLQLAERRTAETLTMLNTLQACAPVGFGFVDRDFRVLRVNALLASQSGLAPEDQIGRTVEELLPDIWPQVAPIYRQVLETGEAVLNVDILGGAPSELRDWLGSFYPVPIDDEIIGIGFVVIDVTERRAAEKTEATLAKAAVSAIAAIVEVRDPYTAGHQRRVAHIAAAIAADLGLNANEVEGIRVAANIHDIGKVGIPSEILTYPGPLRPPEWELMKAHARIGSEIIAGVEFPWPIAEMILQHHERCDGSGYPDGLRGDEIVLGARIIAVADTVEAMASHRPYRAARGLEAALAEITRGRSTLYDPHAVDSCLRLFAEGHIQLEL